MILDGNIRLLRPMTQSRMGPVWLGRHLTLDTDVAVELLVELPAVDAAEVICKIREIAGALRRIDAPAVVPIVDMGVALDAPWVAREVLDGEPLADILVATGPLGLGPCVDVVWQLADALDKAQAAGLPHGALAPASILLAEIGGALRVRLLHFGLYPALAAAVRAGLGTPAPLLSFGMLVEDPSYLSPERLGGALGGDPVAVDRREARLEPFAGDRWALAVCAYEMLTGELPFAGETGALVCRAVCEGWFVPPSERCADLPLSVDRWFARALHADPERRFASAAELGATFRAALLPVCPTDPCLDISLPAPYAASALDPADEPSDGGGLEQRVDAGALPRRRRRLRAVVLGTVGACAALLFAALLPSRDDPPRAASALRFVVPAPHVPAAPIEHSTVPVAATAAPAESSGPPPTWRRPTGQVVPQRPFVPPPAAPPPPPPLREERPDYGF